MDKIFEEYKQYCKKHSKKEEGQSKTTLNQYCVDVKFVLDCSNSNIEDMYKDEHSFNACFEKYENYVRENNLDEKTLSSYRSDCKNFYKFWQERKNHVNYYWVNQGKEYPDNTYYVQAPDDEMKGHKLVQELKPGDIILSYKDTEGGVFRELTVINNPEIFEKAGDSRIWYRVKIKEDLLNIPISRDDIKSLNIDLSKIKKENIPWNRDYKKVKQKRYLVRISYDLYKQIKNIRKDDTQKEQNDNGDKKMDKQPKNIILYGPPGTGKTYNTVIKAMSIIDGIEYVYSRTENGEEYYYDKKDANKKEIVTYKVLRERFQEELYKKSDDDSKRIEFITFHQSYSYEEFVEGIKPVVPKGDAWRKVSEHVNYKGEDGIFKKIRNRAIKSSFDELYEEFKKVYPKDSVMHTIAQPSEFKILEYNEQGLKIDKNIPTNQISKTQIEEFYKNHKEKPFEKQDDLRKENSGKSDNGKASYIFAIIKELEKIEKQLKNSNYVLIIDEINRGNISKIFGELITLIEEDKREMVIEDGKDYNTIYATLPYSGQSFSVPNNLYIIGTMNTADRSIALLDTALRRRFDFEEMPPKSELLEGKYVDVNINGKDSRIDLKVLLDNLNENICKEGVGDLDKDHKIGHAFLINVDKADSEKEKKENLRRAFLHKIYPLLEEYFYDDDKRINSVLGNPDVKLKDIYKKDEIWLKIVDHLAGSNIEKNE